VITADQIKQVLGPQAAVAVADASHAATIRFALHDALHVTFLSMFAISIAVCLIAWLVPHVTIARRQAAPISAGELL
jgi:hypothetical protein